MQGKYLIFQLNLRQIWCWMSNVMCSLSSCYSKLVTSKGNVLPYNLLAQSERWLKRFACILFRLYETRFLQVCGHVATFPATNPTPWESRPGKIRVWSHIPTKVVKCKVGNVPRPPEGDVLTLIYSQNNSAEARRNGWELGSKLDPLLRPRLEDLLSRTRSPARLPHNLHVKRL